MRTPTSSHAPRLARVLRHAAIGTRPLLDLHTRDRVCTASFRTQQRDAALLTLSLTLLCTTFARDKLSSPSLYSETALVESGLFPLLPIATFISEYIRIKGFHIFAQTFRSRDFFPQSAQTMLAACLPVRQAPYVAFELRGVGCKAVCNGSLYQFLAVFWRQWRSMAWAWASFLMPVASKARFKHFSGSSVACRSLSREEVPCRVLHKLPRRVLFLWHPCTWIPWHAYTASALGTRPAQTFCDGVG
eukprot:6212357-Pleurochrysis_carterae.AAC.2